MILLKNIYKFLLWWFWKIPKNIAIIFSRILVLVNSEASFLLNVKMLFVPLFGDYTWVGRIMGIIYRIVKIVLGLVLLTFLAVLGVFVFSSWYISTFVAIYFLQIWVLPLLFLIFLLWKVVKRNLPDKRVEEVGTESLTSCFRPRALAYKKDFIEDEEEALEKFLSNKDVINLLKRLEINNKKFKESLKASLEDINFKKLISTSFGYGKKFSSKYVEVEHLFLGILANHKSVDKFLSAFNLDLGVCEGAVNWVLERRKFLSQLYFWQPDYEVPVMGGVNRAMTGRVTPALDSVSVDFTKKALEGTLDKVTGHKDSTEKIIEILGSSDSRNVLIIGPSGSGKTSVVKRIAQQIIAGTKESPLRFKRVVSIDAGSLISGASTPGEVSERIKKVMEDASGSGNIILFFDEIHNLVLGQSTKGTAIFSLLEPYFSSEEFQIIGATDLENYRKHVEPNGSFSGLFKVVEISETNEEETLEILEHVSRKLEKENDVFISYPALHAIVKLAEDLIHERVFPDKAIRVLSRAVSSVKKDDKYVEVEDVENIISEMTKVPVSSIQKKDSEKLLNIERELKKRVIGQDHAIEEIGKAMKRAGTGVRDEDKPIASFLFVGTTGVGKTETAKALSEYYFGSEDVMIRLDMSEYQHQDSIKRLLGDSDGEAKGLLTEAVRSSPYALILLDEIEKAYPQVITTFLQVLDDGRLTDPKGRTVDFSNTIIISTSNVGTRSIQKISEAGGSLEEIRNTAFEDVKNHFAPEFLNRFSGVIVYNPLDTQAIKEITKIMLGRVKKKVREKGIKVKFTPELINELAERGYSKEWGARPLRRVIEDSVETYIAVRMLSDEVKEGDEVTLGLEVFEDL